MLVARFGNGLPVTIRIFIQTLLLNWYNCECQIVWRFSYESTRNTVWLYHQFLEYHAISKIQQCFRQIFHNAQLCNKNVHTYAHFCYKVAHCGIWDWCILGFVHQAYWVVVSAYTLQCGFTFAGTSLELRQASEVILTYINIPFVKRHWNLSTAKEAMKETCLTLRPTITLTS